MQVPPQQGLLQALEWRDLLPCKVGIASSPRDLSSFLFPYIAIQMHTMVACVLILTSYF